MSHNSRVLKATPHQVWSVLSDGWLYPLWVVGATRMREVDGTWPQPDACLHHSVGAWPATLDDTTSVVECTPESLLRLRARAWPSGEADVKILLEPHGQDTLVTLEEDAVSGPARLMPALLRQPLIGWRNVETLRRLAFLAERRAS